MKLLCGESSDVVCACVKCEYKYIPCSSVKRPVWCEVPNCNKCKEVKKDEQRRNRKGV